MGMGQNHHLSPTVAVVETTPAIPRHSDHKGHEVSTNNKQTLRQERTISFKALRASQGTCPVKLTRMP